MEYGTLLEKKALAAKSGWWAGGAILFLFGSAFLIGVLFGDIESNNNLPRILFAVTRLLAAVFWVVGCGYYARSKGWSSGMGILGILTCIGLLVLVLLPDKWSKALKHGPAPMGPSDLTNYPR